MSNLIINTRLIEFALTFEDKPFTILVSMTSGNMIELTVRSRFPTEDQSRIDSILEKINRKISRKDRTGNRILVLDGVVANILRAGRPR